MKKNRKIGWIVGYLVCLVFISVGTSCAHTARLVDESGNPLALAVDSREKIDLNGTKQRIYIAGASEDNPVILWLDGGPGGSEVGWVRTYLAPLHEQFTIVCWDQRGTAGSYAAAKDGLLVEQYVQDVISLSNYLADRFNQEKIVLMGHSWGSVIGLLAAQENPGLFHAYIGAGQQINSIENDTLGWQMVLKGARASEDHKTVALMEKIGRPPYLKTLEDGSVVPDGQKYFEVLSRLFEFSPHAPADASFRSEKMFLAPEHSFADRINLVRGLLRGVKEVYPQLAYLDFEKDVKRLDCPLFLVNGRYDMSCVSTIAERWFNTVEAPYKELLWLEESGHNGVYTESKKFMEFMTEKVLPLATT
ncbi:putative hydrolase or acyltransferase of alpha/beta superfamily [Sphaerochaeta pleomorpha str. Grapes]|uniref:Proline iminopeptidase n=1 Tax=Sphaerochaeta pleomorpha (strain ATCC BAA-1885 / DSM 22778 / Grapes) TaxID=158190 RepID=G8QRX7_SPHPG|nr:alpha/beta hydrolase [Sphaerochaeta pleomorpha]AEV29975.1 putative hydrolase or acyltransferase of alpha/beta superfamily [Sphaerochaeta pleomorpha str. Grapes]